MTNKNDTLVKLENAGVLVNDKWLVRDVSLEIKKGKIIRKLNLKTLLIIILVSILKLKIQPIHYVLMIFQELL